MTEPSLDIEYLMENSGWLKGLALSLVSDDASADDAVQETWLAALSRPPRDGRAVRSWLARAIRNLAKRAYRAQARRVRRESLVARSEVVSCTPEQLLQRAELQRDIADAIIGLKESQRSVILLRFFEELSPAAISRREGIPVGTVRSRLAKGLEQLRVQLDRRYGGDRQAWCSILIPLVGFPALVSSVPGSLAAGVQATAAPSATITKVGSTLTALGGIVMTQKLLVTSAAIVTLSLGGWLGGYHYAQRKQRTVSATGDLRRELAVSAKSGRQASEGGAPTGGSEPRRRDDREHRPEEENLSGDMSAADIIAYLNRSRQEDNPGRFHQSVEMLCALARRDPRSVLPLLSSIEQRDVMDNLSRALVSHGGREGLNAVLSYITDSTVNMDMRREAILGLGRVSPEAQALAQTGLYELMTQDLPIELHRPLCNVYGDVDGEITQDQAFQNLMELLNDPACRVRPEFLVQRAGEIGTPEDTSALLSLLGGSWTRAMEESILGAVARTAGSGAVLLSLLQEPPEGVARETIAHAINEAEWFPRHNQMLIDAITGESNREVFTHLARALGRSGGEGLDLLLGLAEDPDANIDADSLAVVLAESARPEFVPTMAELLTQVKERGTVHRLARAIAEAGGGEGVDTLLKIIENEAISPDWFYLLSDGIARNGRPEDARRLFELLEGDPHPDGAYALLKTAYELSGAAGPENCLYLLHEAASGDVRAAAAEVMGRHDPRRYLPELVDALGREEFERAERNLASAIAGAGPEGVAQLGDIIRWDANAERKSAILEVLASDYLYEAVAVLREALAAETNEEIRAKLADSIAKAESR